MTIRDLTPEQITELQAMSVESFEFTKKQRRLVRAKTPKQEKIWQDAFSAGVKAALSLVGNPEAETEEMPTLPGRYLFRCMENSGVAEELVITQEDESLIVHCPHLGRTLLKSYHDGLSLVKWRKLA